MRKTNINIMRRKHYKKHKNKADNSAIGAELTSQRSNLTFEVKGNHDKKLLILQKSGQSSCGQENAYLPKRMQKKIFWICITASEL